MKTNTIIVTGGAGFIGSALVWRLNREGEDDILIVDSLGAGDKWKNLSGLRFSDYQEKDDFLARIRARDLPPSLETIFHFGACSSTVEADTRYLVKNNFEYSKTLARYALESGVRFIYASSAATYGDGSRGYGDRESGLGGLRPLNKYGFSKHLFDLYALRRGWLEKIVGLKFFNVFGPNEYHKGSMRSMVCKGYEQIRNRGRLQLFQSHRDGWRDGEQDRDFIYIKDALEMILFIYRSPTLSGIFNIGSGTARTWNDLALAIFDALQVEKQITYVPMPEEIRDTYQYHTEAKMEKLRRAGYDRPVTSLEEAVKDYARNYLAPGRYLAETGE
jgi:ADP-L-glycero-D-manno-heptose 6-epimerase